MANKPTIGFALGSGGARGLAHAGVLEALGEAGLKPDVVAGTSMGAIVGGLYAQDPNPAEVWRRLESYVGNEQFAAYWAPFVPRNGHEAHDPHARLAGLYDFMQRKLIAVKTITRPWIQEERHLRGPLVNLFGSLSFAELRIPFAAVALDLRSGHRVLIREGSVVDGIYASSAIPAVFPPVERDGMIICDGGGPYRVPVEACRDLGATFVVAVDIPAFEETHFSTGLDYVLRSNTIARQRLNEFVCASADFVIRPDVTDVHWADFGAAKACRARGHHAAQTALPELQAALSRHGSLGQMTRRSVKSLLRL